jgi:hypothetical protein
MNKRIIYITFIGLIGFLLSCQKEDTKVTIKSSITAPSITTVPDLTLKRANGTSIITFAGTPVDPGFQASATYFLEADTVGNGFKKPVIIASGIRDTFSLSISSINSLLLARFPQDQVSQIELRVRAVLSIDAGTGYTPIVSISDAKTAALTIYGPPALKLTTDGVNQTVTSLSDNKVYTGWIYTDGTAFTLTNSDDGKIYGSNDGNKTLTEGGSAITLAAGGYNVTVDMTNSSNITFTAIDVTIGIIGDATTTGWGSDYHMIYDFTDHTWNLTSYPIKAGGIKFRTTGTWGSYNVAYRPNNHDLNNLYQSHGSLNGVYFEADLGDSQNIDDVAAGTYNIKLYLETKPWKVVFTAQ